MSFDQFKIVFKGTIKTTSPLIIGCGIENNTDSDILKDFNGIPFIPGTSFAGIIRHHFEKYYFNNDQLNKYFGWANDDSGNQSKIIFSDLNIENNGEFNVSERDGIKIDNTIGIAEDKHKFDYEILEPGAMFSFRIEIGSDKSQEILKIIKTIKNDFENEGIKVGAKTKLGFGRIKLNDSTVSFYNLKEQSDVIKWLKKDETNQNDLSGTHVFQSKSRDFEIEFDFVIKDSLIIKHYTSDAQTVDSEHIKSQGKSVIPASSIKGVIRARAERILNTIGSPEKEKLVRYLFGCKLDDDKGSIPSRLEINEVIVEQNVDDQYAQQRIKIDRFTGGTIDGALFDSQPIFAVDDKKVNKLKLIIEDAKDPEKGLMLLILKDFWTSDLPIGGEKNIGHGVLKGKKIKFDCIEFEDITKISKKDKESLESFINSISDNESYVYISEFDQKYEEILG